MGGRRLCVNTAVDELKFWSDKYVWYDVGCMPRGFVEPRPSSQSVPSTPATVLWPSTSNVVTLCYSCDTPKFAVFGSAKRRSGSTCKSGYGTLSSTTSDLLPRESSYHQPEVVQPVTSKENTSACRHSLAYTVPTGAIELRACGL